jgi:hypothetical protein
MSPVPQGTAELIAHIFQPSLRDSESFCGKRNKSGVARSEAGLLGGLLVLGLIVEGVDDLTRLGVAQNDPRLVFDGIGV